MYNEVINYTEDQQMLMAIVRNRYGETISMLAVTNVAANISVSAAAEAQWAIGPALRWESNIIPLSTGVAFEDNPTISYVPIEGEEQFERLMAPVPLDVVVIFARSVEHRRLPFLIFTQSINHIRNPNFIHSPLSKPHLHFLRVVDLLITLGESGHLDWVFDPREDIDNDFSIVIRNRAPRRDKEIRELYDLLGLEQEVDSSSSVVLPVYHAVEEPASGGIAVTTSSIYDLIEMLSASIDVPEKHKGSGLAINYPQPGLAAREVRIARSDTVPKNASVSIKYRNSYYYIRETDQATKLMFRTLRILWKDRIASTTKFQSAPILTLPVSN